MQALIGVNTAEAVDYELGWQSPGFEMENSVRLVFTPEGQLVGNFEVHDQSPSHVRIGLGIVVHPDYWDSGLPEAMIAWQEARARQALGKAPEGVQVTMRAGANQNDLAKKRLMESQGMEIIRHFLRMQIEFESVPQTPVVPEGIVIWPYHPETEMEALAIAYLNSFQDHFDFTAELADKLVEELAHWTISDPDHDPELWFLAEEEGKAAGLSICTPRVVEDPEMGHVYILGVGRAWRGRGLGLALLRHSFVELHKKGCKQVSLEVDASSLTGATRLYQKAGMSVTRQFETYSKVLRDGEDITTTSL